LAALLKWGAAFLSCEQTVFIFPNIRCSVPLHPSPKKNRPSGHMAAYACRFESAGRKLKQTHLERQSNQPAKTFGFPVFTAHF